MIIECEKCAQRKWKYSDLENLVKYAPHIKIATNMRDGFPHPYTPTMGKNG